MNEKEKRRLAAVKNKAENDLKMIGLLEASPEIRISSRMKKSWGNIKLIKTGSQNRYIISLNPVLLKEEVPEHALYLTLVHEYLHAGKDCMCHQGKWKAKAELFNAIYHTNIQRTSSCLDLGIDPSLLGPRKKPDYKYCLICLACKKKYFYQRAGNAWRHPERYRCRCGGKLARKAL